MIPVRRHGADGPAVPGQSLRATAAWLHLGGKNAPVVVSAPDRGESVHAPPHPPAARHTAPADPEATGSASARTTLTDFSRSGHANAGRRRLPPFGRRGAYRISDRRLQVKVMINLLQTPSTSVSATAGTSSVVPMAEHVIAQSGPHGGTGGLVGRSAELALVDALFAEAATRSAALFLTGAAGVGKSALLNVAARRAEQRGFRVVRAAGAQFDQHVGFAGLNQILLPLAAELASLPARQARTLQVILGLSAGEPEELAAVAYAVRGLLFRISTASSPLALVIDDYARLDRPSAAVLDTVACQAGTGRVALLAASRRDEVFLPDMGTQVHEVRPLDAKSAMKLVAERFPAMTSMVRRRLLAEAKGNPLALLELPVSLSLAQQTQRRSLPTVLPLTERLRTAFSERVRALPDATRKLLLLTVLDDTGDLHLLSRTGDARRTLTELSPAERAGLVRVDARTGRLFFRHPLTRSAIMELSTSAERRWAHRTLADVLPEGSERRALHLARATVGPDDQVAALLHEADRKSVV